MKKDIFILFILLNFIITITSFSTQNYHFNDTHEIIKLNNKIHSLTQSSNAQLGLSVIGVISDILGIIDLFGFLFDNGPTLGRMIACNNVFSQSLQSTKVFPTTSATFCGLRNLRGNIGYNPDIINTNLFFSSQDDVQTHIACMKARTEREITLESSDEVLSQISYVNDFMMSELSLLSGATISCISLGCFKIYDAYDLIENNKALNVFHHEACVSGVLLDDGVSVIWFSSDHVLILNNNTEISAKDVSIEDHLKGGFVVKSKIHKVECDIMNIHTESGEIKYKNLIFTDKHKQFGISDTIKQYFEKVRFPWEDKIRIYFD